MIKNFNIRVYAIIENDNELLLSHEKINDFSFVKFPGGGVEKGEGIKDALIRELKEEGNIDVLEIEHFYTTDFFQTSAFNPEDQIVSVYYKVKTTLHWKEFKSDQSTPNKNHFLHLKFHPNKTLNKDVFTFPIDKLVWEMIDKSMF